jgi:tRNA threonylcarbamoyladenosine biosynthesis protein TsaB
MTILTIRTDKPEAEIGLYHDQKQLTYVVWEAHRQLAETIHRQIINLLDDKGWTLSKVEGIIVYEGPGSFTGLRIGMSVANALAYSLNIPIVATGGPWIEQGVERLQGAENDKIALPKYGGKVNVTKPRK